MVVLAADRARLPVRPARDRARLRPRLPGLCPRAGEPVARYPRAEQVVPGGRAHRGAHPRPRRGCPDRGRRPAPVLVAPRPIDERSSPSSIAPTCSAPPRVLERADDGRRLLVEVADRAPALPVRHRRQRPRPPHAHARRRPRLARDRAPRHRRRDRHRRALRRGLRLSRRPRRPRHDALRRHPLRAALHLLRDHAGGVLRPELRLDVHRRRRRRVARHGAHRPRPDALDQAPGIRAGGRGARRRRPAASCAATSSRTRSGR